MPFDSAITIRPATATDLPVVHDIQREAVETIEREEYFVDTDREFLENHLERDGFILVAMAGDECAGFVLVDLPGRAEENLGRDLGWPEDALDISAHMDTVCVRPAFRGHGLQKRLVRAAEERLAGMGFTRFLATIHPDNVASLYSMLGLGYQVGATKRKYGGVLRHVVYKC